MDGMKILQEQEKFITGVNDSHTDDAMPRERLSDFSTECFTFEEQTLMIMEQTEDIFAMTGMLPRHSSEYLKALGCLEKSVKYLGSAYITKLAMSAKDQDTEMLSKLNGMRMARMVSFNMRKINAALNETKLEKKVFDWDLYDMLLRYSNLLNRLRNTEAKGIRLMYHMDPAGPLISRKNAFTDRSSLHYPTPTSPFRDAPSFEVMTDVLDGTVPTVSRVEADEEEESEEKSDAQELLVIRPKVIPEMVPFPEISIPGLHEPDKASRSDPDKDAETGTDTRESGSEAEAAEEMESLSLTVEEMITLISDPEFCRQNPQLAIEIVCKLNELNST